MVGAFGEVQVVDWGLAKVLRRGGVAAEQSSKQTIHTTTIETVRSSPGSSGCESMVGSVMGTPAYMAPEQAQGEIEMLDERADVFSLGAILCEVLTGRPPYEPLEGESIVSQAAHAKLKPARERIESCDADPALVELCLGCLMTSREARPASAAVVARVLHEYLVSVEERAAKAELAAAEARIKAAEERRARRLTVALGGTIGLVLLLAGGGAWWVGREREKRLEQTRVAVEDAQGEALDLGRAGRPDEALLSARRALSLAEAGDADATTIERVRHFVAQAEEDVGAAGRERTRGCAHDWSTCACGRSARSATTGSRAISTPRSRKPSATTASSSRATTCSPR
jgi:eukaryotic-like serine/threonine-protein kinase